MAGLPSVFYLTSGHRSPHLVVSGWYDLTFYQAFVLPLLGCPLFLHSGCNIIDCIHYDVAYSYHALYIVVTQYQFVRLYDLTCPALPANSSAAAPTTMCVIVSGLTVNPRSSKPPTWAPSTKSSNSWLKLSIRSNPGRSILPPSAMSLRSGISPPSWSWSPSLMLSCPSETKAYRSGSICFWRLSTARPIPPAKPVWPTGTNRPLCSGCCQLPRRN